MAHALEREILARRRVTAQAIEEFVEALVVSIKEDAELFDVTIPDRQHEFSVCRHHRVRE